MKSKVSTESQQYLNFYFQVHQPRRLRRFQFFDIGSDTSYFDDELNERILRRIANACYLPTNQMLLKLIGRYPQVRFTFSISGVALEQLSQYAPSALESFRKLAASGAVEFLAETYYHSLSFLTDPAEFIAQIKQHERAMIKFLGVRPTVFRNTELIYSDSLAQTVYDLGFKGMYLDGIDTLLKGRSVNKLYQHPKADLVLFPRNYRLSDDIAFRFSDRTWSEWPLTSNKFTRWLNSTPGNRNFVSLGMDYETFGEHQKAGSGIFGFLEKAISRIAIDNKFKFLTPSEAINLVCDKDVISSNNIISWADKDRDLSAWLGNDMQRDSFNALNKLYSLIISTHNLKLAEDFRHLQTSDHFYYMSTKKDDDGNVHQYFSPYTSPYEAFMNYMNVLADIEYKVNREIRTSRVQRHYKMGEAVVV